MDFNRIYELAMNKVEEQKKQDDWDDTDFLHYYSLALLEAYDEIKSTATNQSSRGRRNSDFTYIFTD